MRRTMIKKSIVALVGVGMFVAIAALWLRVRELEQAVNSLTLQLQSRESFRTIPVQMQEPNDEGKKKQIFRLIDSHEYAEPETGPFHPEVDRAMMIDAIENQGPVKRIDPINEPSAQIETSPSDGFSVPDTNSLPDSVGPFRRAD
jgi:hypothetical protein